MATRWRVLNRRRARKIRRGIEDAKWERFDLMASCHHQWEEEYYGHRCKKCDLFYAHGQAPWDYYDEDDDFSGYEPRWFADDDDWGCCLGDECLMPSYDHRASECYNVEMAEAWADEAASHS